jgi:DNA replication licensing factor MCM4
MGTDGQEEYLSQFIWGTQIPLQETMNAFHTFLRGFKLKYRAAYNAQNAKAIVEAGGTAPPRMALYDDLAPAQGEQLLYEKYIKEMRDTGITSLNLDLTNILAFPPTKKLYNIIMNYPQELIPIMDNVLRDVVLEMVDEELEVYKQNYAEGTIGELDVIRLDAEIEEMAKKIWKVRPFGGERTVNMRDLNPSGKALPLDAFTES